MNKCEKCGMKIKEDENHICADTVDSGKLVFPESTSNDVTVQHQLTTAVEPKTGWRLIGPDGNQIEVPSDQLVTIPAASNLPEVRLSQLFQKYSSLEESFNKLAASLDAKVVKGNGNPSQDKPKFGDKQTTNVEMFINSYERLMGLTPKGKTYHFSGLRDMYFSLTGDYNLTGRFNAEEARIKLDPKDVYGYLSSQADDELMMLAYDPSGNNADTTTMAELTRNVMNKVMVNQAAILERYRWWQPIVKRENFDSLQQISWVRLGGVGDLPTVPEKAEYTQLAWDDARTTADWVKKGGYLPLSLEMIDRDDLAGWRAAPVNLVTAAMTTISGTVSAIFTDNAGAGPSITTEGITDNLFSAAFGNVIGQALDATNWLLAVETMYKLEQLNVSGRRIGTRPRYALIPIELEGTGYQAATQGNDPGSFNDVRPRQSILPPENVITVPHWTNANNWAAVADPMECPIIGVGFRFGEAPELFTEPSNTGLMFFNDVMPIKVRWFYAVSAIDPRGAIKSNL